MGVFEMLPLRRADAELAARATGVNTDAFLEEVQLQSVGSLASRPLTLHFLLNCFRESRTLGSSKTELYEQGCRHLLRESSQFRQSAQHTGELDIEQRLAVASRIAAITILCNQTAIQTDSPPFDSEGAVSTGDLAGWHESVRGKDLAVEERHIKEVLNTGLFNARGAQRMGWAHQTYAEYLAARYLSTMDIDQVLSLIKHQGDPEGRIPPQLHETAAWLVMHISGAATL